MQLLESLDAVENCNMHQPILTTGFFDGLHLGHQQMIRRVAQKAKNQQKSSVVLTYWPQPKVFFSPSENQQQLLLTKEEKISAFAAIPNLDFLCIVAFDRDFSRLTAEEFVQKILIEKLQTSEYVLGFDHHFGKQRKGNYQFFRQRNFNLRVRRESALYFDNAIISSSRVRKALQEGRVVEASQMLGNRYSIKGTVVKGAGIGRTLGFATANLSVAPEKLIPQKGVYSAVAIVENQRYNAIVNIGAKPTFLSDASQQIYIEAHLLHFDGDLYGKAMAVEFVKYLREERKFKHKNDLIRQIQLDLQDVIAPSTTFDSFS